MKLQMSKRNSPSYPQGKFIQHVHLWKWLLLVFLVNAPDFATCLSSRELCLSKICSGCIAGSLSCQEGGLTRLPDQLSSDIQSIILIGHRFDRPYLLRENFSTYSQQTENLQRLTLRNCGLKRLQPGAFESLKKLTQLDLSQNQIRTIEPGTFAGLKLEFLRLDENFGLHILPGGFDGLFVASLSMNLCRLETISYDDLAPLLVNPALENLQLSSNQIKTFDKRLESAFVGLESLAIDQNPLHCDCRLKWLVDVLQQRQMNRRTRTIRMLDNADGSSRNVVLDGDLLKPMCREPNRLRGKMIESLTENDFYCDMPQLKGLEIDLSQESIEVNPSTQTSNQSNLKNRKLLALKLKCHVKGSPELEIAWYKQIEHPIASVNTWGLENPVPQLFKLSNSITVAPGITEVHLLQPNTDFNNHTSRVLSYNEINTEELVCVATDTSGNTSAQVKVNWPKLVQNSEQIAEKNAEMRDKNDKYPIAQPVTSSQDTSKSVRLPTRFEIKPDWYLLETDERDGFWFKKQFSVLEMIGAVVGTFTITLSLFVLVCCLVKAHRHHHSFVQSKVLLHQTASYHHSSPASKDSTSPTCVSTTYPTFSETALGIGSTNANANQSIYHTSLANYTSNNGTITSDFTLGAKCLPYAAYASATLQEPLTSALYSDSQTYDLPQLPPIYNPPNAPLPPIPSTGKVIMTTHSAPVTDPMGLLQPGTVVRPMFVNNPNNMAAVAATLTRMNHANQIPNGQVCLNMNGSASQQNLALAQNHYFSFVNQSPIFGHQLQATN